MSTPVVHGPGFSTYTRSVLLTLAEKGVEHELKELDFVGGAHKVEPHIDRHPWGKVPAFEHDGQSLYETLAIITYIDAAFDGPALQPADAWTRARMMQVLSIVDAYGYTPCVGQLFLQRAFFPSIGAPVDEDVVASAIEPATRFATELDRLLGGQTFFCGAECSLADIHVLPVITYLAVTPEGAAILESTPNLRHWIGRMNERESVRAVMPQQ